MELRKLGRSKLEVSKLCFGGNVFGWTIDEKESFRLLDTFVDLGFNFIDTADVYSVWAEGNKGGESETILGRWLKSTGRRKDVVLATKVGAEFSPSQKGLSKEYIRKAVEASLQRLQTDYIDLYQSHYDDLSLPVTEPLEVYSQLIAEGKVRFVGASNFSPARLKEALEASAKGLPRYESLQPLYNLVERSTFENEFEPLTSEYNLGVISYYSLASGFLTGKYRTQADLNKSPRGGGVKKYLEEGGLRVLSALDQVAEKHQATPAQVALAWLTAQKAVTSAIVSATSTQQLRDIAGSVSLDLDDADLDLLDKASA